MRIGFNRTREVQTIIFKQIDPLPTSRHVTVRRAVKVLFVRQSDVAAIQASTRQKDRL